jgi:hypothetical protein
MAGQSGIEGVPDGLTEVPLSSGVQGVPAGLTEVPITPAAPPRAAAPDLTGKLGEGTYPMWNDAGHKLPIPYSAVPQAQKLGYQFDTNEIPERKMKPADAYQQDYTQDPSRAPVGFSETARRGFTGLGKGVLQSINPNPTNPQEAGADAAVPGGAIVERGLEGIARGAIDQGKQAVSEFKQANTESPWYSMNPSPQAVEHRELALGHGLAAAIPGLGPMAAEAGQQIGEHVAAGDIGGAIAAPLPLAATMASGELAPKVIEGVKALPDAARAVAQDTADEAVEQFRRNRPVEGENYTQGQHKSLSGVLARGTGMGKDYFPKQVAQDIGSPLRQVAADNPEIVKAIRSGAPEDALAATQNLLDKAKGIIDDQHQAALQPVANAPFDPKPVQAAVSFPKSLEGFSPEDAEAVADLKQRLGNVNTLGGANELRMYLNRELAPSFRKNAIAAGRSGTVDSAMSDALSALRGEYYDQLEKVSGQDFSAAKRTESSLMKAQEALGNAAPQLASKEALIQEPKGIKATVADALTGARTLRGGPISGTAQLIAEKGLGETPLGQMQEGLQRFFSKLPDRTPPPPEPAPQFSAARRALSPPSYPQLPASVIPNAEVGPAGQPTVPSAAPSQASPGFNVSPEGAVRPGAPAAPTPAIVMPAPDPVPQLPAQAGPEGQGIPPGPPTSPPPPVNEATSRMRVEPLPANPAPVPATPAGFTVLPEGVAQRAPAGLLPGKTRPGLFDVPTVQHPDLPGHRIVAVRPDGLPIVKPIEATNVSPTPDDAAAPLTPVPGQVRPALEPTTETPSGLRPATGAPANEQRISAEQPAGNAANGRPEEAEGAIQKQPAAQVDERQSGQGGREDGGRVQPVEQGSQPAGESAVQAKPGGEENRQQKGLSRPSRPEWGAMGLTARNRALGLAEDANGRMRDAKLKELEWPTVWREEEEAKYQERLKEQHEPLTDEELGVGELSPEDQAEIEREEERQRQRDAATDAEIERYKEQVAKPLAAVESWLKKNAIPYTVKGSDFASRYLTVDLPNDEEMQTRFADHAQPTGIRGHVRGGFSETGEARDPSALSIDPDTGATAQDAIDLIKQRRGEENRGKEVAPTPGSIARVPVKSLILRAAGEMERNSPLFSDSEANPQGGLFSTRSGADEAKTPPGASDTAMGSDGKLHYRDADGNDLGAVK